MTLVQCPYCGPREQGEFTHDHRQAITSHRERWLHALGCGRWLNVVRDTVTHEITGTYPMGESGV